MVSKESEQVESDDVGEPTIQAVDEFGDPLHSVTHLMTKILE